MKNNGNIENFTTILENYKRLIFKVAAIYCRDPEERKDLVQEISLQIWKSLPNYNDQFALSTWIYRIALNVSISHIRKETTREKIHREYHHDRDLVVMENDTVTEENLNRLYGFINNLKPIDKGVIILYLEGRPNAEIADIMGMSVTNISTRIHRIKNSISKDFRTLNE